MGLQAQGAFQVDIMRWGVDTKIIDNSFKFYCKEAQQHETMINNRVQNDESQSDDF